MGFVTKILALPPPLTCTGFFLVMMGALCLVYSICALRTNLVLFLILFLLVPTFGCLTAAYFFTAMGNVTAAAPCVLAGGALAFVICLLGWYIFTAILLAAVDFPLNLPGT
jgi:succinate-acetate transporter protein